MVVDDLAIVNLFIYEKQLIYTVCAKGFGNSQMSFIGSFARNKRCIMNQFHNHYAYFMSFNYLLWQDIPVFRSSCGTVQKVNNWYNTYKCNVRCEIKRPMMWPHSCCSLRSHSRYLTTRSTWLTHDLHPRLNRQSWTTSDAKLNIDSMFFANIIVYSSVIQFFKKP